MPGSTDCYVAGNRPIAELSHVLGYHLAMARKPSEGSFRSQSFEYALSRVELSIPSLISLLKINRNEWIRRLKRRFN